MDIYLVQLVVIWHIFSHFGILYQEKSGNPDSARDAQWFVARVVKGLIAA
jgi:hypothetical protein